MKTKLSVPKIILSIVLSLVWATPVFAHLSPAGCTGSGLGINLFTNLPQVNIGDTVSYSVVIFNGTGVGPVVCDASNITASLVTPDGVNHPLTLVRTSLSNGQSDTYTNVVTYIARTQDITAQGTLAATASDTGIIHQNITDSMGGGNQGLNVFVLNTLHVVKLVVNDNGGTATAASFNIHVRIGSVDVPGSPAAGTALPGTSFSLIPGTYVVSEDANASYTQSFSGDCDATGSVTLLGAQDRTCTITNNDIAPATITVIKTVINDNGGTGTIGQFPLFVGTTAVVSGVTNTFPAPGTYTVSETLSAGYTRTFSGDCDANGTVTLVPGANLICTITNNDIPPVPISGTINVVKTVINDNGGTGTIGQFPLFVGTTAVVSGVTNTFPAPGTYTVSETASAGYNRTFSGDCDANGTVTLVPGDNMVCIVTNDDVPPTTPGGGGGPVQIPPLIDVVKVPNPQTLPGPGSVIYTYTVRNIGTVPMTTVTLADDTCNSIVMVSGDTNNNGALDLTEIWIYTCTTTLTATRTNTVVATGFASGLSSIDTATATVVVGGVGGGGITPPAPGFPNTGASLLIHVTKVPSRMLLPIGGGMVTFTYTVTNPGIVALSNVSLSDNRCSQILRLSGDTNNDNMLDVSESWVYTCSMNLTRTTTNTVVARGEALGLTITDLAVSTVAVPVPGLPATGFQPGGKNTPWSIAILSILMLISASPLVLKKRTI